MDDVAATDSVNRAQLLRELINNVPTNVYAIDAQGICLLSEGGLLAQIGLQPGQNVGIDVFVAYEGLPPVIEALRAAQRGEATTIEFAFADRVYTQSTLPRRNADGTLAGAFCILMDVTERRRDEQLLREQVSIIQAQKQAIMMMSTPIIEVWDDVLAVPLVGVIDHERAAVILRELLAAISHKRTRFAILDLTGVENVDPSSAEHLVRIIRSVKLLGSEALVTGIRPGIAQIMVGLGLDLGAMTTLRSLQEALRYCTTQDASAGDATLVRKM